MNSTAENFELMLSEHKTTVGLITAATLALFVWLRSAAKQDKLPPGPKSYPLVGNALRIGRVARENRLPQYIKELHDRYGKIIRLKMGPLNFVFISDGELLKNVFGGNDLSDRPIENIRFALRLTGGKKGGIFLNNGPNHYEMRKLTLTTFRDLGVGKKSIDENVLTECNSFCQYLERMAKETDGVLDDLKSKIRQCTANVIHSIVLGNRYEYGDKRWLELIKQLQIFFSANLLSFPENFVPVLRYVPFVGSFVMNAQMKALFKANDYIREYLSAQIEQHRSTYVEGEVRDFIDLFIKNELESAGKVDVDSLFLVIVDIFRAGADTTATSLAWSLQYLVTHPDIQEELRKEIDAKIGDQEFNRVDKRHLVKTTAFVYEVQRFASIAPATPPHTTRKPLAVGDYVIPANSFVFGSLYTMHHDDSYWGDPEIFRITRWIDEKGQIIQHDDNFLPFSTGKRVCVGRQLANIELIIFLVHLLQRFKFERAPGYSDYSDDQSDGFLRSPLNYRLRAVGRE